MDITIQPGKLSGSVHVIPSKSQAHRLLICAAFADRSTTLRCPEINRDIQATADCLNALGATILRTKEGYEVTPLSSLPQKATLYCCESGSTLRFLLPIAGALGVDSTFLMEGRLSSRPLSPLWEEMERMGCHLSWEDGHTLHLTGRLRPGQYHISGAVSSQFISGLLLAAPLMDGNSSINIIGNLESGPYVKMTQAAMSVFGVESADYTVDRTQRYHSPGMVQVEGDWSNGAFWLCATGLGSDLKVTNLNPKSPQGDRKVTELLPALSENVVIDVSDIPDLVPILSVVACTKKGAIFQNIQRLRLKESDRVASTIAMIRALGGKAKATEKDMIIHGTGFTGGTVDACNDHRIAMAAAIASTVCSAPVTILGAQCVEKSYPLFWEVFKHLGGKYELNLR